MRARALLVVPPFVKSTGGPMLGPAMLRGAAEWSGHEVEVLDLNNTWLVDSAVGHPRDYAPSVSGDHDKPTQLLHVLQREFSAMLAEALPVPQRLPGANPVLTCTASFEEMDAAVELLAGGFLGDWLRRQLAGFDRPDMVGISVMYSGQVLCALTLSAVVRALWPGVPVIWGGPHVTALRDPIRADGRYGRHVDAFVFGYAERTFAQLVDAIAAGVAWPRACVRAGSRVDANGEQDRSVVPVFARLDEYALSRLTLPAQASRGCAYAKCAFCTYPAIEGTPSALDEAAFASVLAQARALGAVVSFKDALASAPVLERIASVAKGVEWSACTKMTRELPKALPRLAASGLDTLEIGLETLVPESKHLIGKVQSRELFFSVLGAAEEAGVAIVVNYITGFPGEDAACAQATLDELRREIDSRRPTLRAQVEHNPLQLERLAPLASSHSLRVVETWPWASVMRWELAAAPLGRTR